MRRSALALALGIAASLALAPRAARAAGYAINDQGLRALGQGLAVPATLEGPETLFYNPAGLAAIDGWQIATGLTRLGLDVTSRPAETGVEVSSSRDQFVIPHLYVAHGLRTRSGERSRWALGLSVNAPFGLATEWPLDYEGRFISRIADLKTVQAAALAAVRLPRGWSLGFGPTWTTGDVQLVRDVDLSVFRRGHSAEADLTGDGSTLGWRFGARWQGDEGWRFGLAWHGQSQLEFEGDVDYTVVPLGAFSLDQAIATLFVDGPAATTLTLPATGWAGFGRVRGKVAWEVAFTWTNWSVMDEVVVDLEPVEAGGLEFVTTQFLTPKWHDTRAVRAGTRVTLGPKWSVGAGLAWDEAPVPVTTADPLLPDSDRILVSAGVTRTWSRFVLDLGTQWVRFDGLDTKGTGNPFESAYESDALALGVTASWRFGK